MSSPSRASSFHTSSHESRPSSRALTVSSHTTSRSEDHSHHPSLHRKEGDMAARVDASARNGSPSLPAHQLPRQQPTVQPASQPPVSSIVAYLAKQHTPPYFAFTAPQDMSLIFNEPTSKAYIDFRSRKLILVMRIALRQYKLGADKVSKGKAKKGKHS